MKNLWKVLEKNKKMIDRMIYKFCGLIDNIFERLDNLFKKKKRKKNEKKM